MNTRSRICVCISGQLRGDNNSLSELKSQLKELEKNSDVTYIFSLWKNSGSKVDGVLGYPQLKRIFTEDLISIIPRNYIRKGLWNKLPKTHKLLKDTNSNCDLNRNITDFFPNAIIDLEEEALLLEFETPKVDKNSIKMLYKRWRCNEIKKNIEVTEPFNLVIILRPDLKIKINNNATLSNIEKTEIYVPQPIDRINYTNDTFAYGDSKVIDKYCELFHTSMVKKDWTGIHQELSRHLENNNIKKRSGSIIKSDGLSSNKLMSTEDVFFDNKFLYNLVKNDLKKETLNIDELCSYYTYKHILEKKNGEHFNSLRSLLKGDFSLYESSDFSDERWPLVLGLLFSSLFDNGIFEIEKLASINSKASQNIVKIFSIEKNIEKLRELEISFLLKKNDYQKIKSKINKSTPNKFADIFRDKAICLENEDLKSALFLMGLARKIRPNGPFIEKKYNEYLSKATLNK